MWRVAFILTVLLAAFAYHTAEAHIPPARTPCEALRAREHIIRDHFGRPLPRGWDAIVRRVCRVSVLRVRVAAGADDGWITGGAPNFDNTALYLRFGSVSLFDQPEPFLRFIGVTIPRSARIVEAHIEYVAHATLSGGNTDTYLQGEAADNPTAITDITDFGNRTKTNDIIKWHDVLAMTAESVYRSPDIAPVLQEIVNRPGWKSGNAMQLFHRSDGGLSTSYRQVYSYDGDSAKAALLVVEYEVPRPPAAIVRVHDDSPPFRPLAELRTAHDIHRKLQVSGPGQFEFACTSTDASVSADVLREGRLAVITSTEGLPPYVGRIERIEQDMDTRVLSVTGDGVARVLWERQVPSWAEFPDAAAGVIAMQLLSLVNSYNPTGIVASLQSEPGSPLRATFTPGGQSLGEALDELAVRVGDEWWIEEDLRGNQLALYLRWGTRRGSDKAMAVHLYEGQHFSAASYARDLLGTARSVTVIGGTDQVSDRPSAARGLEAPNQGAQAGVVDRAAEQHVRLLAAGSPMTAREVVRYLPEDDDEAVLATTAEREIETPATAAEAFEVTLTGEVDWGSIGPGDIITAELPNAYFDGVTRRVRILALQPDEPAGEMPIAVRLERDA